MTGWRLGYIRLRRRLLRTCEKLRGQFTSGTNSITQKAAVVVLTTDLQVLNGDGEGIHPPPQTRHGTVSRNSGVICAEPDGAFMCSRI